MKITAKLQATIDKMMGVYTPGTKIRMLHADYGMRKGTITTVEEPPDWDKSSDVWIKPKGTSWGSIRVCVPREEIERVTR